MARARQVQFANGVIAIFTVAALLAVLFFGLFAPALAFREPPGHDPSHAAVRGSALRVVLVWCFAWSLALVRTATGPPGADAGRLRALWALGCVLLWVHIALAFHLGHGWSHPAAWEHTRAVGGYGDGIFVNYALALVWLADAGWAWVAFGSYLARPRWLTWTVHGFIAFVVFAAVAFGGWPSRVAFGLFFLAGGVRIVNSYRR